MEHHNLSNSLSVLASALAAENISFSFDANAQAAHFNAKNRHLTLPVWNVTDVLHDMLVEQQISHALWTPTKESEKRMAAEVKKGKAEKMLTTILNIVEGARIEKKMKMKYPGTRRDFYLGYKEILDSDILKFSERDWNEEHFLTRVNTHNKWGVMGFIDLDLNDKEKGIVREIDYCQSFDEAFDLAVKLYEDDDCKEQREEAEEEARREKEAQANANKGQGSKQPTQGDGTGAKGECPSQSGSGAHGIRCDMVPTMAGQNTGDPYIHATLTIQGLKNLETGIISSKELLADFIKVNGTENQPNMEEYRKYANNSSSFVRQLAAQFERKKAADEIRREREKDTGMINPVKLPFFNVREDIFLTKTIRQDGKNHGVVFLLDFSSSMQGVISSAFSQLLQLIWFCERVRIPFEVFAFTNMSGAPHEVRKDCPNGLDYSTGRLMQIATSNDSAQDREKLLSYIHSRLCLRNNVNSGIMHMNGTPTVESLAICSQFIMNWIKARKIQIPTVMVVTDGDPNGLSVVDSAENCFRSFRENSDLTVINNITGTTIRVSPKSREGHSLPNVVVGTMLESLRRTTNARIIGMFVGPQILDEHIYAQFCKDKAETGTRNSERYQEAKRLYEEGCVLAHPKSFPGYDEYFVIRGSQSMVTMFDALNIKGSFTKMKNHFIEQLGKQHSSRIFLSRYVDIVSGQPIKKNQQLLYTLPA